MNKEIKFSAKAISLILAVLMIFLTFSFLPKTTVNVGASGVGASNIAVTDITGVPSSMQSGTPLTLTGTVLPDNATNKTVVWSIASQGITGATLNNNVLSAPSAGNVTVRATITDGVSSGVNYTKDFKIAVINPVPSGYTGSGIMAYKYGPSNFDIIGHFYNGWKQTTYDSKGFETYLKEGTDPAYQIETNGSEVTSNTNNFKLKTELDFKNDGKLVEVKYTITNISAAAKTFSLGSTGDVQIGYDDSANITMLDANRGFKMVSDESSDKNDNNEYAQFNFFGKYTQGVTTVDAFWYGYYYDNALGYNSWCNNQSTYVFYDETKCDTGSDYDSAMAYSWKDRSISAGETQVFKVLIGIGGAGSEETAGGIIGYNMSGIVSDESSTPISGASIKLTKGGTDGTVHYSTTSDASGAYQLKSVLDGSYSLVVTANGKVITKQVTISGQNLTCNITVPDGNKNTKINISAGTPSTSVENMENMFSPEDEIIANTPGANVEIKLQVSKIDDPADANLVLKTLSGEQTLGMYLDAKLLKTITGAGANNVANAEIQPPTGQRLKIVIELPLELQGKEPYEIVKVHNGVATSISAIYDPILQTLTFYADQFSTYAIIYGAAAVQTVGIVDLDEVIFWSNVSRQIAIAKSGDTIEIKMGVLNNVSLSAISGAKNKNLNLIFAKTGKKDFAIKGNNLIGSQYGETYVTYDAFVAKYVNLTASTQTKPVVANPSTGGY